MATVEENIRYIRNLIHMYSNQVGNTDSEIRALEEEIESLRAFKQVVENSRSNYKTVLLQKEVKLQSADALSMRVQSARYYKKEMQNVLTGRSAKKTTEAFDDLIDRITERINNLSTILGQKRNGVNWLWTTIGNLRQRLTELMNQD